MEKITRKVVLVALALGLGGCISVPNPIEASKVFELENAYGVAQSAATIYVRLPRCAVASPPCSRAANVIAIGEADKKARIALGALEDFARNPQNYPNLNYSALVGAATSAIGVLQAVSRSS